MQAPERFVDWLSSHTHAGKLGHKFRYHPRSDAHSKALCGFMLTDLLEACPPMLDQAAAGEVVYGINVSFTWQGSGKKKTLDLAIGPPETRPEEVLPGLMAQGELRDVYFSCEVKSVMTEHGKSQPRVFDELSSSHEIVHKGRLDAIATGVCVVNIADTFISPLRQTHRTKTVVTQHKQPEAASRMVDHLRGLAFRDSSEGVGFDAYATIVIDCDNKGPATLWTETPAPQPLDRDSYSEFLKRVSSFYSDRFS